MIQNLTELARECGSGVSEPSRQREAIIRVVLSHSEGLVRPWVHTDTKGVNLISKDDRIVMRFPFEGDKFWQDVEWLHEEALVVEEEAY